MATQTEIMKARPTAIAIRMSKDEELLGDIEMGAQAKNYVRRGPMIVLNDLRRIFGKELDSMPIPDSEGGNNPDLYPIDGSKRKGSYYNDLYDLTEPGAADLAALAEIAKAKKAETQAEAKEPWCDMEPADLDQEESKIKKNRTYKRGVIKNAMALNFKLAELKTLPLILVQEGRDADGSLSTSPTPYIIRDADIVNHPGDYKPFSVDTIIKINTEKVMELGGTFKALKLSLKRDNDQQDKAVLPELQTETVAPYIERVAQLLDRVVSTEATEARMVQYLLSDKGQDALLWFGRTEKHLAGLMKTAGLSTEYAKLEAELDDRTATKKTAA